MMEAVEAMAIPGSNAAARESRFAALVGRQSHFVFQVAYALLRNAHDAEDVAQETFLKIYRAGNWESIENERAFLARIAWRSALDKRRKLRHEELTADIGAAGESPEDAVVAADWNAAVRRLVDALPAELRKPLALAAVNELNSREIAGIIGIAEGTVRTRIMRARQILKQKLAGLMEGRYGR